jgi:hypothetical protein
MQLLATIRAGALRFFARNPGGIEAEINWQVSLASTLTAGIALASFHAAAREQFLVQILRSIFVP